MWNLIIYLLPFSVSVSVSPSLPPFRFPPPRFLTMIIRHAQIGLKRNDVYHVRFLVDKSAICLGLLHQLVCWSFDTELLTFLIGFLFFLLTGQKMVDFFHGDLVFDDCEITGLSEDPVGAHVWPNVSSVKNSNLWLPLERSERMGPLQWRVETVMAALFAY